MKGAASSGRSTSRSPPFVVVGLTVALTILGFYYWRLSSLNSELAFQLEEQRSLVRMELTKRANAEKRSETVMNNLKGCEDLVEKDKSIISEKESTQKSLADQVATLNDQIKGKEKSENQCKKDLKKCQDDTSGIQQELQKLKENSSKRDQELEKLKSVAAQSQNCNCDKPIEDTLKSIEAILEKSNNPQVIQTLQTNGIKIGKPPSAATAGLGNASVAQNARNDVQSNVQAEIAKNGGAQFGGQNNDQAGNKVDAQENGALDKAQAGNQVNAEGALNNAQAGAQPGGQIGNQVGPQGRDQNGVDNPVQNNAQIGAVNNGQADTRNDAQADGNINTGGERPDVKDDDEIEDEHSPAEAVPNRGGEAPLDGEDGSDGDVVGKKVIDEAEGNVQDDLKFKPEEREGDQQGKPDS